MFDWSSAADHPTLYEVDRPVSVYASAAFPGLGSLNMTGVPLWVRAYGFRPEPIQAGRLRRWLRCYDNSWLGQVEVEARSYNGHSRAAMQLWLPAAAFYLDRGEDPRA